MIKFLKTLLLSTFFLSISPITFAANEVAYGQSDAPIIYTMNGSSGFVFNRLKAVSKVNSQGYEILIIDSSSALSANQISQAQNHLNKGGTIVVDAKAGIATAQDVARSIAGFSVNAEAMMISKSNQPQGGYNVTPISSGAFASKISTNSSKDGEMKVSNTVNDVFGL